MGENLRENMPPPSTDSDRRSESISNSSSSSSITMDTSKEFPLCCSQATLAASTEWTNEKHNLYLNSLETSFVNELYHSMRLRDWRRQKNARGTHSSREFWLMTQNSSDQFMVVQDGSLQKINLQRNETLTESTADSHVNVESPWISPTSAGKSCNLSFPKTLTLSKFCSSARGSEQNLVCHQDLGCSTTELSGQNFVDEDRGRKLSNESIRKRLKRAVADASNNDQIVPSGNFDTKDVSMVHNVFSDREEQGHRKSDLHCFLGGR